MASANAGTYDIPLEPLALLGRHLALLAFEELSVMGQAAHTARRKKVRSAMRAVGQALLKASREPPSLRRSALSQRLTHLGPHSLFAVPLLFIGSLAGDNVK